MMLTFELDNDGSLEIFFDHEGRDRLIELIRMCEEPGDHQHLWVLPDNVLEMTPGRFLKDSKPFTYVELGIPGPTMKLILDEERTSADE